MTGRYLGHLLMILVLSDSSETQSCTELGIYTFGREFVAASLPLRTCSGCESYLLITGALKADQPSTNVTVRAAREDHDFNVSFALTRGQTQKVVIPATLSLTGHSDVSENVILVTASQDVAVTHYSMNHNVTASTLLYPTPMLGSSYHAVTGGDGAYVIVIAARDTATALTVTMEMGEDRNSSVQLGSSRYAHGDTLSATLAGHEAAVLYVDGPADLTGTRIQANDTVAVFSGSWQPRCDSCRAGFSQESLLPVDRWGKRYFVHPDDQFEGYIYVSPSTAGADVEVVTLTSPAVTSAAPDTTVTGLSTTTAAATTAAGRGGPIAPPVVGVTSSYHLATAQPLRLPVTGPVLVTATSTVQMYVLGYTATDFYLLKATSQQQQYSQYFVHVPAGPGDFVVTLTVQTGHRNSLLVDGATVQSLGAVWNTTEIGTGSYSSTTLDSLSPGNHEIYSTNSLHKFSAYATQSSTAGISSNVVGEKIVRFSDLSTCVPISLGVCGNGVDDDCDGEIDEHLQGQGDDMEIPSRVDSHWSGWSTWSGCNCNPGAGHLTRTRTRGCPLERGWGTRSCDGTDTGSTGCPAADCTTTSTTSTTTTTTPTTTSSTTTATSTTTPTTMTSTTTKTTTPTTTPKPTGSTTTTTRRTTTPTPPLLATEPTTEPLNTTLPPQVTNKTYTLPPNITFKPAPLTASFYVGTSIGVLAFFALLGLIIFWCHKNRQRREKLKKLRRELDQLAINEDKIKRNKRKKEVVEDTISLHSQHSDSGIHSRRSSADLPTPPKTGGRRPSAANKVTPAATPSAVNVEPDPGKFKKPTAEFQSLSRPRPPAHDPPGGSNNLDRLLGIKPPPQKAALSDPIGQNKPLGVSGLPPLGAGDRGSLFPASKAARRNTLKPLFSDFGLDDDEDPIFGKPKPAEGKQLNTALFDTSLSKTGRRGPDPPTAVTSTAKPRGRPRGFPADIDDFL